MLNLFISELSKHVKKCLEKQQLQAHAQKMELILEEPFLNGKLWLPIKEAISGLVSMICKYCSYLDEKSESQAAYRSMNVPTRSNNDNQEIIILHPKHVVKPTFSSRYKPLTTHLLAAKHFEVLSVDEYTPPDTHQRRFYIDNLHQEMPCKCVLLRVSRGNNLGTLNFMWKVPVALSDEEVLKENVPNITRIQHDLPVYHTCFMRRQFIRCCSLISAEVKPAVLRHIYKTVQLQSLPMRLPLMNVQDKHLKWKTQILLLIYVSTMQDSLASMKYFFQKTREYLDNVVEVAADERRHDSINHLASAISVRDLREQVAKTCPEGTALPSEQWLRLQFAPKNPSSRVSLQYTGQLDVKYAIQSRQFRCNHADTHYAAAIFRYLREFACKFRDHVDFACSDDKHHVKVGEPGNPVAAVDRGRRVITANGVKFAVSDHDFTKWSVVPSVTMLLDIPEDIEGSFYRGEVWVGVKDIVLEPSSPLRHAAELVQNLERAGCDKPVLLLYTDSGPDHRCTYLSVQLTLLSVFLQRNYDMLVAVRTPPQGSWRNPPERIMSVLNLALQCVGLQRRRMGDQHEAAIASCSGIKALREAAEKSPELREAMADSVEPVKVILF